MVNIGLQLPGLILGFRRDPCRELSQLELEELLGIICIIFISHDLLFLAFIVGTRPILLTSFGAVLRNLLLRAIIWNVVALVTLLLSTTEHLLAVQLFDFGN